MKRKWMVIVLAIGMMIIGAMPAFAGTWKQDANGWWYDNGDGTYQAGSWFQDSTNAKWYFASQSGYIIQNAWLGNYYLGADGAMLVNTTTPDGYKVGPDGAWIPDTVIDNISGLYKYSYSINDFGRYESKYSSYIEIKKISDDSVQFTIVFDDFSETYTASKDQKGNGMWDTSDRNKTYYYEDKAFYGDVDYKGSISIYEDQKLVVFHGEESGDSYYFKN